MNTEDRDYLDLIEVRGDPDADKRWLITCLEAEARELAGIDLLLDRRDALADCKTRYNKIVKALEFARRAEAAEARAEALEAEVRRLAKTAKTAAARAIAEWGTKQVMGIAQLTLAETVMDAIDAALTPGPAQGREDVRTWCPECGYGVRVDEDGLCISCGVTAVGKGVDQALAFKRRAFGEQPRGGVGEKGESHGR